MQPNNRILITGGAGMVGAALTSRLRRLGYSELLVPPRAELDLTDRQAVLRYVDERQPEYVFMIAAKVGGIAANIADPVGFMAENLRIQVNLFEAAQRVRAKKCLFLGSSCIYPRDCPQPMREDYLLTGPLEPTNEGYALAKIAGLRLAQSYEKQFGLTTVCPMPCNIYGTGDHFDFQKSHVLSALVRRFVEAHDAGRPDVTLWGTGVARREFLHVDDVVDAILLLMQEYSQSDIINVGSGEDVSIRELAQAIAGAVGFRGEIRWDASQPDGMPRKCLDVSRLRALGWTPRVDLATGIARTVTEYRELVGARASTEAAAG